MGVDDHSALHLRLTEAVGDMTYRRLAQLTETHPETVRRYMHGQSPSTEFLANLCRVLSVNANWLLTGRGPMRVEDMRLQTLRSASPGDLLTAMAGSATHMQERIDQLEGRLSRLEALAGSTGLAGAPDRGGVRGMADGERLIHPVAAENNLRSS